MDYFRQAGTPVNQAQSTGFFCPAPRSPVQLGERGIRQIDSPSTIAPMNTRSWEYSIVGSIVGGVWR